MHGDVEVSVEEVGRDGVDVHTRVHALVQDVRVHRFVRVVQEISPSNLKNARALLR